MWYRVKFYAMLSLNDVLQSSMGCNFFKVILKKSHHVLVCVLDIVLLVIVCSQYETPKGLIRVQGPNVKLTSIAVQLDEKLTAGDVLNKYHRQCERMQRSTSGVK